MPTELTLLPWMKDDAIFVGKSTAVSSWGRIGDAHAQSPSRELCGYDTRRVFFSGPLSSAQRAVPASTMGLPSLLWREPEAISVGKTALFHC